MRLKTCHVENFGSYSAFEFDFSNLGLGLIYGPTGSGKSTIQDIACWVLYGVTAKNGAVDEVRSWQSPGDPTKGTIEVELPSGTIAVTRIRGKATQNDLYWTEAERPDDFRRGKDLVDTQRLLEQRLGVSADTYLTSAYFHEFSEAGTFFTAKAKDRRALFERIASLDLPVRLAERSSVARKATKADLSQAENDRAKAEGRLEQLKASKLHAQKSAKSWETDQVRIIETLQIRARNFEDDKAAKVSALHRKAVDWEVQNSTRIDELVTSMESLEAATQPDSNFTDRLTQLTDRTKVERCGECGGPVPKLHAEIDSVKEARATNRRALDRFESSRQELMRLSEARNPYTEQVEQANGTVNTYLDQITTERGKANPFAKTLVTVDSDISAASFILLTSTTRCKELEHRVASLTCLYDLSFELRGELLKKAVREIETSTNGYLDAYFDAELRVAFSLDGDSLEVEIQKSGYDCVYRQLSKGQRGLLKLCFVVSVMKAAANNAGVHFAQLMFDEALDGLDTELKVKAFRLFEELETDHETVLLIDHATEFKSLFARQYRVTLVGDSSEMSEESEDNG